MKEISYQFQEPMKLKINGKVFTVQADEADIYEHAYAVRKAYEGVTKESATTEIVAAVREVGGIIDLMLGKGAMRKISGGKAVRMADAVAVMNLVLDAVSESYAEKLKEYE